MIVILGSSSPARLETLRRAGLDPIVVKPDVDESLVTGDSGADVTARLARLKGETVLLELRNDGTLTKASAGEPVVVIACDTMLEIEGRVHGKPGGQQAAVERWKRMRGLSGQLFTGHYVAVVSAPDQIASHVRVAETGVTFADLTDNEISAYAATGEPERVAGAFTIDGLGGPFVTRVDGDPHNVVGISLPLVRQMLIDMGIDWSRLWSDAARRGERFSAQG